MEVGAIEAKNKLGMLLDRVEEGEEITITRHGRPVARLVPHISRIHSDQARAALQRMRGRVAELHAPLDWVAAKRDRDAGRP